MRKFLSFDVGETNTKYACINEDGSILAKGLYPSSNSFDEFILKIVELTKLNPYKIEGLCLSLPGAVDYKEGVVGGCSALSFIHGPNIKKILEETTKLPVEMENDANCAALGEVWLGNARDKEDALLLVIGTGVGGAIIKNRQIHRGKNLHGGEFGYMISDWRNDNLITLGDSCSIGSLVQRIEEKLDIQKDYIEGIDVFNMAQKGNLIAQEEVNYFYKKLAQAIYNLQYSFDPEIIILGGAVSQREDLIPNIKGELDKIYKKLDFASVKPQINTCHFHGDSNLIGAVKHFLQERN